MLTVAFLFVRAWIRTKIIQSSCRSITCVLMHWSSRMDVFGTLTHLFKLHECMNVLWNLCKNSEILSLALVLVSAIYKTPTGTFRPAMGQFLHHSIKPLAGTHHVNSLTFFEARNCMPKATCRQVSSFSMGCRICSSWDLDSLCMPRMFFRKVWRSPPDMYSITMHGWAVEWDRTFKTIVIMGNSVRKGRQGCI